jgi:hypothetical protein
MRELLLRDLERRIARQRARLAQDRERLEHAVTEIPKRAADAIASPGGLAASFALGAAAAGVAAPSRGVLLWDLVARLAVAQLPAIVDLLQELDGTAAGDPGV